MPHVPLKVLRGEEDQEDPQDNLFERFQAPTTATEDDDDGYSNRSSLAPDDIVEVNEAGMNRRLGGDTDSIHSIEGARNVDIHNTGYQTTGSVSHEEIELQTIAQVHVHQPPNMDNDSTDVSEEGNSIQLGTDTGSIHSMSESDIASQEKARNIDNTGYQTTGSVSQEAIELQVFAQVHPMPYTDNVQEDALGTDTGSLRSAAQSGTASQEGAENLDNEEINNNGYQISGNVSNEAIEMQVLAQTQQSTKDKDDVPSSDESND